MYTVPPYSPSLSSLPIYSPSINPIFSPFSLIYSLPPISSIYSSSLSLYIPPPSPISPVFLPCSLSPFIPLSHLPYIFLPLSLSPIHIFSFLSRLPLLSLSFLLPPYTQTWSHSPIHTLLN